MDSNPILKVLEGTLEGQIFEVTTEGLMIGRGEECALRLDDPGVSREHARVFLHNSAVWVQDMGSRNGVFVKGQRLARPKQISPGTELAVGDHRFCVELAESGEPDDGAPAKSPSSPGGGGQSDENTDVTELVAPSKPKTGWILGAVAVAVVVGAIAVSLLAG